MRSLCIDKERRGQKLGSSILRALDQRQTLPIACFALEHLEHFYTRNGYQRITPGTERFKILPTSLQYDYLKQQNKGKTWLLMAQL